MNAWTALALSLKVAGCATLIDLVLGVAVGFLLARRRFPGRELLDTLLTLPMVMPPTVLGYYLLVLIGRHGWLGAWLQDSFGINLIFTWQGAVIAAAIVIFPLVFKPARAAFEGVDGQLEQAARVLGVSEAALFFRVTLPLAWRGILAGVLLGFARALGEFGATLMVAGSIPGPDPDPVDRRLRSRAGRAGRYRQPDGAADVFRLRGRAADRGTAGARPPGRR
jgi:molybdate transport system permease protein